VVAEKAVGNTKAPKLPTLREGGSDRGGEVGFSPGFFHWKQGKNLGQD